MEKSQENPTSSYVCEPCDYKCSSKKDFLKHNLTAKHKNRTVLKIPNPDPTFSCRNCSKTYHARNSLWYHEKKCAEKTIKNPEKSLDELPCDESYTNENFMEILKQNQEFKEMIMEQNKQNNEYQKMLLEQNKCILELSKHSAITNNNTIINNNKFNLNVFLNEHCKDALNITDFINSLQISFDDLENVGEHGFVDGISRILVKGLKQLDVYKRPIHCSDLKRETMHVKVNNVWGKEEESNPLLLHAIQRIADKNIKAIPDWKNAYPDCKFSDSKKSDQYLNIVRSSVGACDKVKDQENYHKIIRKLAKEVMVDKNGVSPKYPCL